MSQAARGRLSAEPLFTHNAVKHIAFRDSKPQFKKGLCAIENPLQLQKSVITIAVKNLHLVSALHLFCFQLLGSLLLFCQMKEPVSDRKLSTHAGTYGL